MTQTDRFTAVFLDHFPDQMVEGQLYISHKFAMAGLLCPCGCRGETTVKMSPARYRVILDGEVSLEPSIAATALPCNSHYFITRGEVEWHAKLSTDQREFAKARDERAVEELRVARRTGIWWAVRRRVLRIFTRSR